MTTTNTRIYIANLGKYNEGELVGEWVNLPIEEEELEEVYIRIKVAHRDEDGEFIPYYMEDGIIYEETAIHDFETDLDITVGEWDNVMELSELVEEIEGLDEYELETVKAYCEVIDNDLTRAVENLGRCTFYPNMSLLDVAYELVEECYPDLPEIAQRYFDYEAFARDLGFDGFYEASNGTLDYC